MCEDALRDTGVPVTLLDHQLKRVAKHKTPNFDIDTATVAFNNCTYSLCARTSAGVLVFQKC